MLFAHPLKHSQYREQCSASGKTNAIPGMSCGHSSPDGIEVTQSSSEVTEGRWGARPRLLAAREEEAIRATSVTLEKRMGGVDMVDDVRLIEY